jgi:hypothetical protein
MIEGPTRALRQRSPDVLRAGLLSMLVRYDSAGREPDVRVVLWSLAPYHDCAIRLDLDPTAFFDEVADAGPPRLRELVRDFGRRSDTAPEAFGGYALTETADGPAYVWVERSLDPLCRH